MRQYTDLLKNILENGEERLDRTRVGTLSIFGGNDLVFDLEKRFPVVTIKKTLWHSSIIEMLWFISGSQNIGFLKDHNVPIWDDWADENGNLGPVYGAQWRHWPGKIHEFPLSRLMKYAENPDSDPEVHKYATKESWIGNKTSGSPDYESISIYQERVDQLRQLIAMLQSNPTGRRHIVTAWNPGYILDMGLPPCHYLFQCYVSNDGGLDLKMSIRSWDTGLGAPFNIAQYALLTHLIARAAGLRARKLIISYGDAHIYLNHVEKLKKMLEEREIIDCPTRLVFKTDNIDIDGYKPEDFELENYECNPFIKLPVAV